MSAEEGLRLRTTVERGELTTQIPPDFGLNGNVRFLEHPAQGQEAEDHARIFKSMLRKEMTPIADVKVLKNTVYSFKNRRIITRWIRDVCAAFQHKTTTLNVAIQITDSYLYHTRNTTPVNNCQLAALAAVWIAAKFEELDANVPRLQALVDVCDRAYTAPQIIDMEETLLSFFQYMVPHTTAINFNHLFFHAFASVAAAPGGLATVTAAKGGQQPKPSAGSPPLVLLLVDRDTHVTRRKPFTSLNPSMRLADLAKDVAPLLNLAPTAELALYLVVDAPVRLGRPVGDMTVQDAQAYGVCGQPPMLYGRGASVPTCVFVERGGWLLLRSPNDDVLRVAEAVLREALVHVEFMRVSQHILGLASITFALAITAVSPEAAAATVQSIADKIGISLPGLDHYRSGVLLMAEKYMEMVKELPSGGTADVTRGSNSSAGLGSSKAVAPLPAPPGAVERAEQVMNVLAPKDRRTSTPAVPSAGSSQNETRPLPR